MKRIIPLLFLLISSIIASAQNNYDVSLIPKDLLPYSSAVVRNEQITTTVNDLNDVTVHVKRVITILNSNGDDDARLYVKYDKITKVKSIKGLIYNEFGKIQQKISEGDFEDVAITDGFSLFVDDRAKVYKKAVTQYPYTIEFEYEVKEKQSLLFPAWEPNPQSGVAVEKSTYQFVCDPNFQVRYKEINLQSKISISTNNEKQKTYTWQILSLKARRYEPLSPEWGSMASKLMIAPEKFAYQNFTGSFSNWQQLGKWVYDKLIADREELSPQTVEYVKNLTSNIADPKLKAKKIFEYMQQKTHYISVQVGIGGYRPFPAADVDIDGYGDCKALVNYTKALLKAVNIDSYYCMVQSGMAYKVSFTDDFASLNQGDHVILCIPFKNDTTWADCTSETIPFGYLGSFTDDRTVLACTPEGGKLLRTPKYTTEENLEKRKAELTISESGDLSGSMETVFHGADYEFRDGIIEEARSERIKNIKRYYLINNLDIKMLEYKQDKGLKPVTVETMKLDAREYGATTNGKFYFSINSIDRYSEFEMPKRVRNRQTPVNITRGHTYDDEITYTLPKGYKLDSDPLNINLEKPFGSFTATMTIQGDQLVYKRKFQVKDGTYSKDLYQDVVDFYQAVADADNYNVTLVKK